MNVFDIRKNEFLFNDNYGVVSKEEKKVNLKPLHAISTISKHYSNKNRMFEKLTEIDLKILAQSQSTEKTLYSTLRMIINDEVNTYQLLLLKKQVFLLLKEIRKITKRMRIISENERKSLDWKFAGMVIDKLCLYSFGILTTTVTCGIFLSSPNFFKLQ